MSRPLLFFAALILLASLSATVTKEIRLHRQIAALDRQMRDQQIMIDDLKKQLHHP
jgi:hypothetical protein